MRIMPCKTCSHKKDKHENVKWDPKVGTIRGACMKDDCPCARYEMSVVPPAPVKRAKLFSKYGFAVVPVPRVG